MQYDIELEALANRLEREGEKDTAHALRAIAAVRRWDKRHRTLEVMQTLSEQLQEFARQLADPDQEAPLPERGEAPP